MALSKEELAAFGSSKTPEWGTPQSFFDALDKTYHFNLDVAANCHNTKCQNFFSKDIGGGGLNLPWVGRCWMNPPYGREIGKWVKKAYEETKEGNAEFVVCLLPARTDTSWFHNYIWQKADFIPLRGRLKFVDENGKQGDPALFPSMLVIFWRTD